jgi:hypothetical protein
MKQYFILEKLSPLLIFLLFVSFPAFAQKKKVQNLPKYDEKLIHFGFTLGINSTDFILSPNPNLKSFDSIMVVEAKRQPGFNLGIVSNLRMGEYFDLRFLPALSFAERRILYTMDNNGTPYVKQKIIESTFIDFPLNLKFKSARLNNGRAYILAGFKYSYDLASQKNVDDSFAEEEILKIKSHDVSYEVGFGLDFYTQYFKFSPEIKMSAGMNNLLVRDASIYSNAINRLSSKVFLLSFNFE